MSSNTTTEHTTRCGRCGRALTSPTSIRRGYGPGCATRIRHANADLTGYKPHQTESARELIDDGGIIPTRRDHIYYAVSTDGQNIHRCTTTACTCPAGLRNTRCYHTAAARILTATTTQTLTVIHTPIAHALAA